MLTVSSSELARDVDRYVDVASQALILITREDSQSLIMVPIEEYRRLKHLNHEVLDSTDPTGAEADTVRQTSPPFSE